MNPITKLSVILLAAAALVAGTAQAQTEPAPGTTNNPPAAPVRPRPMRFGGVIASVDSTNMTLTLKATARTPETKVKVTSTTKITKDGQPGQFSDAVEGVRVSGAGKKDDDGVWTATTLNIRTKVPMPMPRPAPATPPATTN